MTSLPREGLNLLSILRRGVIGQCPYLPDFEIGSSKNISGFVESPSANDGSPVEIIRSAINQTPVKRELSFNPPENNDTFAKNSKEQDSQHKLRNSSASSKRQKVSKIKYFDIALEKRSKSSSQQRNSHDV